MHYDVVVVGGGAVGASVGYFLRTHRKACSVAVIERDKTYQRASTPRASGGVRRLFALPENIALSNFSIPFFERFETDMAVDGEPARIDFKKNGYLFIVSESDVGNLEKNYRVQQENGVNVVWLDRPGLSAKYPTMNVDDLAAAVYSPDDGWLDPWSVLRGLRRKAASVGATFLDDEVVGIDAHGGRVRSVRLKSGANLPTDHVVNAAGAWAKEISAMVGMRVPIEPMRRYEHYFESEEPIEPLPYLKDTQRLAFRPEGKGFSGGVPDIHEPRGFNFQVDHDYFERVVWPALAHRFKAFERTKEKNVMPGLYDQNELDGNVIIGPWSVGLPNFYMLAGFSGHGLMHAPGCGRAMAELILDGGYRTIDLTRFGWQRVLDNAPCREQGII
jgi:FAD-dependent oxidoreductase domain-containing protein 1